MVDYSLAMHIHRKHTISHTFAWLSHIHLAIPQTCEPGFQIYIFAGLYQRVLLVFALYTCAWLSYTHPHLSHSHLVAWTVNTTWRSRTPDSVLAQSLWLFVIIRPARCIYRSVQVSLEKPPSALSEQCVSIFWCCMIVAPHVKYSAVVTL